MHPGSARHLFKEITGQQVCVGGETRWYNAWEALAQVHSIGLSKFEDVVKACHAAKCSKESVDKLTTMLDNGVFRSKLIVALAAVVEVGKVLCSSTYLLESSNEIIFVAHRVFHKLVFFESGKLVCVIFSFLPQTRQGVEVNCCNTAGNNKSNYACNGGFEPDT